MRVHAAAITRGELEWSVDRLPAIPSYELSGVLVDSGDEVYALTPFDRDGVAAEYALVPARVLAPKPSRLSHVEAAALPMGGLTAWQALFVHGRLARGERVLVTGAIGRSRAYRRPAGATRRRNGRGERAGRPGFRHSRRRDPRRRARGLDRGGGAGCDLLRCRTRPGAAAGVGRVGGRRRSSPGSRLSLSASRRPGRRSSESRPPGSGARSCSRSAAASGRGDRESRCRVSRCTIRRRDRHGGAAHNGRNDNAIAGAEGVRQSGGGGARGKPVVSPVKRSKRPAGPRRSDKAHTGFEPVPPP